MNLQHTTSSRQLKKQLGYLLVEEEFNQSISHILKLPGQRVVSPLFSFFYHKNELVKWRAVTAVGRVVDQMARQNMESARVIMRRLMWNLNDESGGIGWGSPEAMGDIMAVNEALALEYHRILISYMAEDENYLEHEMLQRGVLWGVGRLAHARPHLAGSAAVHLNPFMGSEDPVKRGLAAWAAGPLKDDVNRAGLTELMDDTAVVHIYVGGGFEKIRIGELAKYAIST